MQILIVTPNPPYPPQQGAALRNFGILHSLAQAGAKITLLTFCDTVPQSPPERLATVCERIEYVPAPPRTMTDRMRDLATSDLPDLARRLHSAEFRDRLTDLLRGEAFDLIQFEGLEVAAYALLARSIKSDIPIVYDAHNAEFALQKNIAQVEGASVRRIPHAVYSRIQSQRITRFEKRICQTASAVIAVS
jgi:polysaccharide biosynthesis protein PslH